MIESVEHIVRQTGEKIDDEPTLEVIHADYFWIGDHFATGTDECSMKVEDNVDEEDDVHDRVDHQKAHIFRCLILKGHVVGHHDCRVERQTQDDPVPQGFERTVM